MSRITFENKDFGKIEARKIASSIFFLMKGSKFFLEILCESLWVYNNFDQVIGDGNKSPFDEYIQSKIKEDTKYSQKLNQYTKKYKSVFSESANMEKRIKGMHPYVPVSDIRGVLLELILFDLAKRKYKKLSNYKCGCTISLDGNEIILCDDAPKTVDFAGYEDNHCEAYECKCRPETFDANPNHVKLMVHISDTLKKGNIDSTVACVSLCSARGLKKKILNKHDAEVLNKIKIYGRRELLALDSELPQYA